MRFNVTFSSGYTDPSNACCWDRGADNYGEALLLPVVQMAILLSQRYCKEVNNPDQVSACYSMQTAPVRRCLDPVLCSIVAGRQGCTSMCVTHAVQ